MASNRLTVFYNHAANFDSLYSYVGAKLGNAAWLMLFNAVSEWIHGLANNTLGNKILTQTLHTQADRDFLPLPLPIPPPSGNGYRATREPVCPS